MSVDQKIDIELELQDKSSAVLQQISSSVSDVVKHISEMGKSSEGTNSGISHTIKSTTQFNEKTKETGKGLGAITGLLSRLAGPAGTIALLGAGIYAAASAMDEVVGHRLKFENLSTDIGFTTEQMSIMLRTFRRMGMDADESKAHLLEIGKQLKDFSTYGEGSEMFRNLSYLNEGKFAKDLLAVVKTGEFYKAFEMINQEFNRLYTVEGPKAAANFLANINGFTKSISQNYAERSKSVTAAYEPNIENMKQFRQAMEENKTIVSNVWEQFKEKLLMESNEITKKLSTPELGGTLGGMVGKTFNFFDKKPITDPLLLDPPSSLKRKGHKFEFEQEDETKKESNSTLGRIKDSIKNLFSLPGKRYGGPVQQGERVWVGEGGPEMFIGGGGNVEVVGANGPEIIVVESAGMIEQFVPNRWTPQVDMPAFESRFGDWNSSSFGNRFGDWGSSSFGDRFGGWSTKGGGTRPTEGASSPNWLGGVDQSMGPDMSSDNRRQMDVMMMMEANPSPTVDAEFTFKNVPDGIKTSMDGDGLDSLKINKSKAFD